MNLITIPNLRLSSGPPKTKYQQGQHDVVRDEVNGSR